MTNGKPFGRENFLIQLENVKRKMEKFRVIKSAFEESEKVILIAILWADFDILLWLLIIYDCEIHIHMGGIHLRIDGTDKKYMTGSGINKNWFEWMVERLAGEDN